MRYNDWLVVCFFLIFPFSWEFHSPTDEVHDCSEG
jgi:hypothetical protein